MAKPSISIIERRLQGPSAFRASSQPIPLKDTAWMVRWTNSDISADHLWTRINQQGWDYAVPEDLACKLDEIGANERDGRVVRGERGREVLVKIRAKDYAKLQKAKQRETMSLTFDKHRLKDAVVNAVGSEHGDQAAGFIQKHTMTVTDSRERVAIDE